MSRAGQIDIIVYEDPGWQRLLPLVYVRGVFQLICGAKSLLDRVSSLAGDSPVGVWCRPALAEVVVQQTGLTTNSSARAGSLFLNGRGLWSRLPETDDTDWVGTAGEGIACIHVATDERARAVSPSVMLDEARLFAAVSTLPRRDVRDCVQMLDWPWQFVLENEAALIADLEAVSKRFGVAGQVHAGSHVLGDAVHIGAGSVVKPCSVIDAEDGPVWIDRDVTIMPHCTVQGPAYIGPGSLIQPGAVIHEGTHLGPVCKVGGEVEVSIVQGYSNKQHDGFLGHSYVASWVNIAADCINSDLKNTYGTVRVPINGREVETGEPFVGMLMGDHSKAGINVSFPTGAVIGFCSSVFASRSPKFVPSFAWVDGDRVDRFDAERGLEIARKVMARRKKSMSDAECRVFMGVTKQALAVERQACLSVAESEG